MPFIIDATKDFYKYIQARQTENKTQFHFCFDKLSAFHKYEIIPQKGVDITYENKFIPNPTISIARKDVKQNITVTIFDTQQKLMRNIYLHVPAKEEETLSMENPEERRIPELPKKVEIIDFLPSEWTNVDFGNFLFGRDLFSDYISNYIWLYIPKKYFSSEPVNPILKVKEYFTGTILDLTRHTEKEIESITITKKWKNETSIESKECWAIAFSFPDEYQLPITLSLTSHLHLRERNNPILVNGKEIAYITTKPVDIEELIFAENYSYRIEPFNIKIELTASENIEYITDYGNAERQTFPEGDYITHSAFDNAIETKTDLGIPFNSTHGSQVAAWGKKSGYWPGRINTRYFEIAPYKEFLSWEKKWDYYPSRGWQEHTSPSSKDSMNQGGVTLLPEDVHEYGNGFSEYKIPNPGRKINTSWNGNISIVKIGFKATALTYALNDRTWEIRFSRTPFDPETSTGTLLTTFTIPASTPEIEFLLSLSTACFNSSDIFSYIGIGSFEPVYDFYSQYIIGSNTAYEQLSSYVQPVIIGKSLLVGYTN
jgi:hypothetical protein